MCIIYTYINANIYFLHNVRLEFTELKSIFYKQELKDTYYIIRYIILMLKMIFLLLIYNLRTFLNII